MLELILSLLAISGVIALVVKFKNKIIDDALKNSKSEDLQLNNKANELNSSISEIKKKISEDSQKMEGMSSEDIEKFWENK